MELEEALRVVQPSPIPSEAEAQARYTLHLLTKLPQILIFNLSLKV